MFIKLCVSQVNFSAINAEVKEEDRKERVKKEKERKRIQSKLDQIDMQMYDSYNDIMKNVKEMENCFKLFFPTIDNEISSGSDSCIDKPEASELNTGVDMEADKITSERNVESDEFTTNQSSHESKEEEVTCYCNENKVSTSSCKKCCTLKKTKELKKLDLFTDEAKLNVTKESNSFTNEAQQNERTESNLFTNGAKQDETTECSLFFGIETGIPANYSLTIDISASTTINEDAHNTDLITRMSELHGELAQHRNIVKQWMRTLVKYGDKNDDTKVNRVLKLKKMLSSAREKYLDMELVRMQVRN